MKNNVLDLNIILTEDTSPTLYSETYGQTYHSSFGAEQESQCVFIQNGLLAYIASAPKALSYQQQEREIIIRILECGLGTGLNAALTWEQADLLQRPCLYLSCEKFPPEAETLKAYAAASRLKTHVNAIANAPWGSPTQLSPYFSLLKLEHDFTLALPAHTTTESSNEEAIAFSAVTKTFDVIYYDAFSPEAQPELWTDAQILKICSMLHHGGIFCTYCSKGIVKNALRAAGMTVNRLPGPPGKRHVLQAIATSDTQVLSTK